MLRIKIFALFVIVMFFTPFMYKISKNIINDNMEIFFKDNNYPIISQRGERYSIAGVINHYNIENMIVGSSLMQNIVPSEVEDVLGWENTFSLTAPAIVIREIHSIANSALKKHSIKNVIFPLRLNVLAEFPTNYELNKKINTDFLKLYDRNPLNDIMVFANKNALPARRSSSKERALKEIKNKFGNSLSDEEYFKISKDLFSPWMLAAANDFNRPLFINYKAKNNFENVIFNDRHKENIKGHLEKYLEPLLNNYPDTNFYVVIPPLPFLRSYYNKDLFPQTIKEVVNILSKYENLKIYSFLDNEFNSDIRIYKDFSHAHIEVSRYIIQSIKNDYDLVTLDNIDEYSVHLNEVLSSFQMPEIWEVKELKSKGTIPYPAKGCLTDYDAAKLVWGDQFTEDWYNSIPRSPYLRQSTYLKRENITSPPLNASRIELEQGCEALSSKNSIID